MRLTLLFQSHPIKHFTLKRKPKSAALRAELLQKSTDAQNNLKKNPAPTVPLRSRGIPRKMTDTTPLKGIPSRHIGGFASPLSRVGTTPTSVGALGSSPSAGPNRPSPRTLAGRKDGGIKLLDINEQPIGFAQAKKRKRQQGNTFPPIFIKLDCLLTLLPFFSPLKNWKLPKKQPPKRRLPLQIRHNRFRAKNQRRAVSPKLPKNLLQRPTMQLAFFRATRLQPRPPLSLHLPPLLSHLLRR